MKTKSSKRIMGKAISLALTICVLFSLLAPTHIYASEANDNETSENESEDSGIVFDNCFSEGEDTLYIPSNSTTHFEDLISVSFLTNSESEINSISYEVIGFHVDSASIDENDPRKIDVELTCQGTSCFLSMTAILTDETEINAHLFAIYNEQGAFISPFSEENATDRYYEYMVNNNLMTEEECVELKNEYNKQFVEETISSVPLEENAGNNSRATSAGTGNTQYKITAYWIGDNNVSHTLEDAKVEIYDDQPINDRLLATVETSNVGVCTYSFNNPDRVIDLENGGYDLYAKIYPSDINGLVNVVKENGSQYCYQTQVMQNVSTGNVHQITVKFYMTRVTSNTGSGDVSANGQIGQAMQIFQALNFARKYTYMQTRSIVSETIDPVTARYPSPLDNSTSGSYNSADKVIKISGKTSTTPDARNCYDAWDVMMHEYGHHVEYKFGLIDSPGGSHIISEDLTQKFGNKHDGLGMAWSEALANVFSELTQSYFYTHLANISYVNDRNLNGATGSIMIKFNYLSNGISDNRKLGDSSEEAVTAVLWDIYDNDSSTENGEDGKVKDIISLGHSGFWQLILYEKYGERAVTFSDCMDRFIDLYGLGKAVDLGYILTYYKIAAGISWSDSTGTSRTNPISIYWNPQGGSSNYPYNKFFISVLNENNEEIVFSADVSNTAYRFTQSQWDTMYSRSNGVVRISVICFQTDEGETGWYFSAPLVYTLP